MQQSRATLASGLEHHKAGRAKEAEAVYREVLGRDPANADALHLLGVLCAESGNREAAAACMARAIAIEPGAAFYHDDLGKVLYGQGRFSDALLCYEEALRLDPGSVGPLFNTALALYKLGRFEEALAAWLEIIARRPNDAEAFNNLAHVLAAMRRFDDAFACWGEALRLRPDYAEAHKNRASARLLTGDWPGGWEEYEWRWKDRPPSPHAIVPVWDGSPLAGKTILLEAEQGLGDTLQFIRYAPLVRERGGRVMARCPQRLAALIETVQGIDQVFAQADPVERLDFRAPLLSLPRIFRTTLETIPARIPYLSVEPGRVAAWKERMGAGRLRKIGLAWKGNPGHQSDHCRSMPAAELAPLAGAPRIKFFSLQRGPQREDPPVLALKQFEDGGLLDTAAIVMNLDLVITVDTMIAHLAGALGKPVWLLLAYTPDPRWLLDRDDTPWYPGARLFRQSSPFDWKPVVARVLAALS